MVDISIISGICGFVGGIVGSIAVSFFSIRYQRRLNRIDTEKRQNKEYIDKICAVLTKIIETWDDKKERIIMFRPEIKDSFSTYSDEIMSLISNENPEVSGDICTDLRRLYHLLNELQKIPTGMGPIPEFSNKGEEIYLKAKEIRDKLRDKDYGG